MQVTKLSHCSVRCRVALATGADPQLAAVAGSLVATSVVLLFASELPAQDGVRSGGADVLLLRTNAPLHRQAEAHPDWTLRYIDDTAVIFAHGPAEAVVDARTGQSRPWAHFP